MKQNGCMKCKYSKVDIDDLPCRTCKAIPIKWKYTNFEKREQLGHRAEFFLASLQLYKVEVTTTTRSCRPNNDRRKPPVKKRDLKFQGNMQIQGVQYDIGELTQLDSIDEAMLQPPNWLITSVAQTWGFWEALVKVYFHVSNEILTSPVDNADRSTKKGGSFNICQQHGKHDPKTPFVFW